MHLLCCPGGRVYLEPTRPVIIPTAPERLLGRFYHLETYKMTTIGGTLFNLSLLFVFLALTLTPCLADTVTFTGSTSGGGTTFNRPVDNGDSPPTALSNLATDVPYNLTQLSVSISGSYDFSSIQDYDGFLVLYGDSFNPTSPLLNALIANDDNLDFGTSGFSVDLIAAAHYFLVTTGALNDDVGTFINTITGPGQIVLGNPTAVPEPATLLLMCTGLTGVLFTLKKRPRK